MLAQDECQLAPGLQTLELRFRHRQSGRLFIPLPRCLSGFINWVTLEIGKARGPGAYCCLALKNCILFVAVPALMNWNELVNVKPTIGLQLVVFKRLVPEMIA